jgi:DNA repair exonuclease SbcCD ATPase subunit|tara:strand:+ start:12425 stop:14140 length:1716 start_codon:yes stop_codon:yes gene_type:complete
MILFKKIRWKNFLSTGSQFVEIELNKSQMTLMIGANGSGKSTMLDALCFALFNRPFRQIKKEQIVNTINNGDTLVELEFQVGTKNFKIIRGIKPTIFEIYSDGVLQNQNASSVDYQKILEDQILRLNYRAFKQIAVLGSSSYQPFMQMRPRHRREVVEEILDIRVLTHMDILTRNQQTDLGKQIVEARHQCDLIESKHELQTKHFNELKNRSSGDSDIKKAKLQENKDATESYLRKSERLEEEYKQLEISLSTKPQSEAKLKQLEKLETKIEQNLKTHERNLEFFEQNDNCPTCTQKIEETFRDTKIANERAVVMTLNQGMKDLMAELAKTETKITEFNGISNKLYENKIDLSKVESSLKELKRFSDSLHNEILLLDGKNEDDKDIEKSLVDLQEQLEQTKLELVRITEEKKYLDVAREILSDKGAKAKIIKKYLPIMNSLINQHLQSMDFFVSFYLDEEFKEEVKSRHRDTFDYNNFSEGEKMRIDLALVFTWRAIAKMKNSANTNLLILDEIFDSSLDGQGTDDFFKIVRNMGKENIFIISHKGDILFDKFTNIIQFKKEHNFTELKNG